MGNRVAVVGGGASGVMAAITAARNNAAVTIYEKNERILKKLLRTGNGRCNFSNLNAANEDYFSSGLDKDWFHSALSAFSPKAAQSFFEELGLPACIEDGRLYPFSKQASAVSDMLRAELSRLMVEIKTDCDIKEIKKNSCGFSIEADGEKRLFDRVILSTGSPASVSGAYSGLSAASALGHAIVSQKPALVQLVTAGGAVRALAGLRAEAEIGVFSGGKKIAQKRGELLFTDYGLSGIVALEISLYAAYHSDLRLSIDFFPGFSGDISDYITERAKRLGHIPAEDFLTGIVAKRISGAIARQSGIKKLSAPVAELNREEINRLAKTLRGFEMKITGTNGIKDAQVCTGGISTDEIDKNTMESKLAPGLYFSGEAIDIAGACGGYNLQWAWSSGYLAGVNAADELYAKLTEAEARIANGEESKDFNEVADRMRKKLIGKLHGEI